MLILGISTFAGVALIILVIVLAIMTFRNELWFRRNTDPEDGLIMAQTPVKREPDSLVESLLDEDDIYDDEDYELHDLEDDDFA